METRAVVMRSVELRRNPFAQAVLALCALCGGCSLADLSYLQVGIGGQGGGTSSSSTATTTSSTTTSSPTTSSTGTGTGGAAGTGGAVGTGGSVVGVDVTAGLYLHYTFDEGSGTVAKDSSGNNLDGALMNGAGWGVGKFGGALSLAGGLQYLNLPAGVVETLGEVTVTFWAHWGGGIWARFFDFGSGETTWFYVSGDTPDLGNGVRGLRFAMRKDAMISEYGTGAPLPVGRWVHVAVTLKKPSSSLYVDGVLTASSDFMTLEPKDLGHTTQNWIGASQYADPNLAGLVDEFRIYNRALSAGEVASLAALGK